MEHAPAPWLAQYGTYDEEAGQYRIIVTSECRDVCELELAHGDAVANARLIAAAPDMLDTLRLVRPYIAKMVADGVQTAQPPSLVLRKLDRILSEVDA